jgi:glycosyltransferase involved in cell wall biosynthesis
VSAPLSVVILAKDESDRLPAALASVGWADEVLVADTGSSDGTPGVARRFGARVEEIPWEGYAPSRRRALSLASHDWVFFLDADERVPGPLREEILGALRGDPGSCAGLSMPRLSTLLGRPVRHGAWYPDVQFRIGRRSMGFRVTGGRVHESFAVDGPVRRLSTPLHHEPYRDLSDALRKASLYARLAAADRAHGGVRAGVGAIVGRPVLEFLRSLVVKRGFLDGATGVTVAFLHAWYYLLRAAYLREMQRGSGAPAERRSGDGR